MTPPPTRESSGPLSRVLAANILFSAGLFAHAFLYNFYLEALGRAPAAMGRAQAMLAAGGLVALLPAGRFVDRSGAARCTTFAVLLTALGLAAGALARHEALVLAAAALAGAGAATWRVASGPLLIQVAPAARRSRAFSWNVGLLVGAGGIFFFASGALPDLLSRYSGVSALAGRRLTLLAGAAFTLASAWLYRRAGAAAAVTAPPAAPPASGADALHHDRRLIVAVAALFLWMLAGAAAGPFFNLYFAREHGLSLTAAGSLLGAGHVATAAALFASAELAGRRSPSAALRFWLPVLPVALVLLPLAPGLAVAAVLYLVQGLVAPATNPLIDQIILERVPAARRGAAASWRNVATEASGAAGPAAAGLLVQSAAFDGLFVAAAVVAALGAVAVWLVLSRWRPADAPGP